MHFKFKAKRRIKWLYNDICYNYNFFEFCRHFFKSENCSDIAYVSGIKLCEDNTLFQEFYKVYIKEKGFPAEKYRKTASF